MARDIKKLTIPNVGEDVQEVGLLQFLIVAQLFCKMIW
jgi:hypothetical protein